VHTFFHGEFLYFGGKIYKNAKYEKDTFSDDTAVVGLITEDNEKAYREVRDLTVWCQDNTLSLNVSLTKELTLSFKFLGVHIAMDLSWSKHPNTVGKRSKPLPL
jgi:hypothetical protein